MVEILIYNINGKDMKTISVLIGDIEDASIYVFQVFKIVRKVEDLVNKDTKVYWYGYTLCEIRVIPYSNYKVVTNKEDYNLRFNKGNLVYHVLLVLTI